VYLCIRVGFLIGSALLSLRVYKMREIKSCCFLWRQNP